MELQQLAESPSAKRMKTSCASEEAEEKIRNFIEKLKHVDIWFYVYQKDNLLKCPGPFSGPHLVPRFADNFAHYENMGKPIEGIDLGPVKHFSDDDLVAITDQFSERNFIRISSCGRQFKGKMIGSSTQPQDVLVKRWDLFIRISGFGRYHLYPSLFSYQLEFLLNPCVASHPHMAKLIGFSCDKTFALVFDLKVNRTLDDIIPLDDFPWIQRMNVATQVALTLKFFHERHIAVCNFFASCTSVGEDYNIKLFEFDSVLNLENLNLPVAEGFLRGHYNFYSPESWMDKLLDKEWFHALDVFAFGVLLMELTLKRCVNEDDGVYDFIELAKEDFDRGDTLGIPQKMMIELAMWCVQKDPKAQPHVDEIIRDLRKVSQFAPACSEIFPL